MSDGCILELYVVSLIVRSINALEMESIQVFIPLSIWSLPSNIPLFSLSVILQTSELILFQGVARSSCGSSFSNCSPTAATRAASRGRVRTASSRWSTRTRWRGDGVRGRASRTWTTTSWVEPCDIITTRTSWRRSTASGTPTNSTSPDWLRPCNRPRLNQALTNTNRTCSCRTTTHRRNWTWWLRMRNCPLPLPVSSLPPTTIGRLPQPEVYIPA